MDRRKTGEENNFCERKNGECGGVRLSGFIQKTGVGSDEWLSV